MRQQIYEASTDGIVIDRCIRNQEFTMSRRHMHPHFEIYYLVSGQRFYFVDRQSYRVQDGSLVLIAPHQIHKTGATAGGRGNHDRILLSLEEAPLAPCLQLAGLDLNSFFETYGGVLSVPPADREWVEDLLDRIAIELSGQTEGSQFLAYARVIELLFYVKRQATHHLPAARGLSKSGRYEKVDAVAGYIAVHCSEPLTLDSLSQQFFMSKSYLSRIFKEITGCTVHEYITIHRVRRAEHLLADTNSPITEIAAQVGFESLTYFERQFRRCNDCTPHAYRRQQQEFGGERRIED